MSLFVDTSVWSLAMRRDRPDHPAVEVLAGALRRGETICTTGRGQSRLGEKEQACGSS